MKKALLALVLSIPFGLLAQSWFSTNQNADLMISGVEFNNTGGSLRFNHPNGLATDGTKLLVCDRFNNRILVWHEAPSVWNAPPDLVLGQTNFTNNNAGTNKNELNWPGNASLAANGKLVVADTENDRLLIWQSFPTTNGKAADISIHLPTITPIGTQQRWEWPWGVWTDGTRLAAVATMGHTLLFWNTMPTIDNQAPSYTIDLPQFGTPRNISTDGSSFFFVGDHNAKVNGDEPGTFFWNTYPTAARPYDFYRSEWIKGVKLTNGKLLASGIQNIYTWDTVPTNANTSPSARITLGFYKNGDGVDVVEAKGRFYVNNYNGNNVLVFNTLPTEMTPNPSFALSVSNMNANSLDSIGYIQNPALATDGTRLIVTSDFDRRIHIFNNFPSHSGVLPDKIISTQQWNIAPWDNALFDGKFAIVGSRSVAIWQNVQNLAQNPSQIFNGFIGSATFSDLKGVALDSRLFYIADRNGQVYIWRGIPQNQSTNPALTLSFPNAQLSRLSSDDTYFCVTSQSPAAIYIYKVADLANGITTPWKTLNTPQTLNLPAEALAFNGAFAIANQSFNQVLLWKDINQAGDMSKAIVLGQSSAANREAAIGQNRLFMPAALLAYQNQLWVGEMKFSSRVLRFSYAPTGVKDIEADTWQVFPNPLTHALTVQLPPNAVGNIDVYDVLGRFLKQCPIHNSMVQLDLSAMPAGSYFIKYQEQVKKVMKY
ncbi:MAG: T9SS type A sorting domain-containing protein [Saprospiraceae bacterium]|nr:T9SS type A sorting domain-containing protein [Saprospiraceae bacterium]